MINLKGLSWRSGACTIATGALAASAWATPVYHIDAIPEGDGMLPTTAYGINDEGVVVGEGYRSGASGAERKRPLPFRYQAGVLKRLSTGGVGSGSVAGINKKGEMVGVRMYATTWSPKGKPQDMGDPPLCEGTLSAVDINDDGESVGMIACTPYRTAPGLYRAGVNTELPVLPGHDGGVASAINNAGQVVGYSARSYNGPFVTRAFLWQGGVMQDLGTLGGKSSRANGINNLGEIVGLAEDANDHSLPFIYRGGEMKPLPSCGSGLVQPAGLNEAGTVIGTLFPQGKSRAVIFEGPLCFHLQDLLDEGSAGWKLLTASDINATGAIVGRGLLDGRERAYIATRLSP
ncbi:MAG: hypothetical protein ACOZJX_09780 [Pseudomonadota bacterium]